MTSLRNSLDLAKSPLSGIAVLVKVMTLLFPPPFTCNNQAFNETKKTSKPPKDGFDLKANVCITMSMLKLMMEETLKDLARDLCDDSAMEEDDEIGADDHTRRERKRMKTFVVKDVTTCKTALKKLQTFVMDEVDFCVYVVFQMAIDSYTKRQLYKADDDDAADDVNELFPNILLG